MKFVLSAVFVWALVPVILAEDEKSLWDLIGDKVEPSPHIIGGDEAQPGAFPHQVYLDVWFGPLQRSFCGGSLIDPEWVLTAAHCISENAEIFAVLGITKMKDLHAPSTQFIKIDKVLIEAGFKDNNTDIALLKLSKPAHLSQIVQTIRLPAKSLKRTNLAGTPAEVLGWGVYQLPRGRISKVLRYARNKVISNEECTKKGAKTITEWRICSERSDGKGPCRGDSGGPIFMTEKDGKRTLIGIISYGSPACEPETPSVYTRVDHWLEWINKLTRIPLRD